MKALLLAALPSKQKGTPVGTGESACLCEIEANIRLRIENVGPI